MADIKKIRAQFPQYEDMSDSDLLMGLHRKFYPDMHVKEFLGGIEGTQVFLDDFSNPELKEYYREGVQKPVSGESDADREKRLFGTMEGPVGSPGNAATALGRSALQGLTFGSGDEIVARGASLLSGNEYEQELRAERDRLALGRSERPVASTVAEIGGALAVPGAAMARGKTAAQTAAKFAGAGALGGGVYGFNSGEGGLENRLDDAGRGAAVGGLLGAATPLAGDVMARGAQSVKNSRAVRKMAKAAPSRDALEQQAKNLFGSMKGAQLPRADFAKNVQGVAADAAEFGMDDMLTPQASRVVGNMQDVAANPNPSMTMNELNVLRRQAAIPAGDVANRPQAALGVRLINAVDQFVDDAAPQLGEKGREARKMWSTLRKMDEMDEIFSRAEAAASGLENGLKNEFRKILKSKKLRRGYTKAELSAMAKVVNPGVLGGLIRQVGRLGVSLDNGSNALGGALGAGIGGSLAGPVGAVITPLVGTGARKASEVMTTSAAKRVGDVIRTQGAAVPQITQGTRGLIDEMLLRSGKAAAGHQGLLAQ